MNPQTSVLEWPQSTGADNESIATSSCIGTATPAASEHPADRDNQANLIDLSSDLKTAPRLVGRSSPQSNGPPPIPEHVDARSDDLIDLSSDIEIPLRPVDRSSPHSKGSLPNSSQDDVKSNDILITDSGKVYPLYRPPFESRATKPSNAPSRDTKTMWNDFRDKCITLINTEDSCIKKGGSQWTSHNLYQYRKTKKPFHGRTFTQAHHEWDLDTQGKCLAEDNSEVKAAREQAEASWSQFHSKDPFSACIARGATLFGVKVDPLQLNFKVELDEINEQLDNLRWGKSTVNGDSDWEYVSETGERSKLQSKKSLLNALAVSTVGTAGTAIAV
ncbi:hypothetical protein I302_101333 [Kwoniella bestiolae CBS 10118]|uniref:Uncharacterized protein n=1 Tax=Kwoniella bestiolae CBS 10118 TaxID=1296100 RepID=A0A1B9GBY6_9TREE|nr:hypothetical protein I302_00016 [Kwoniella bestiolae CBS 10118]OCF28529.1 hypothetical protein I302_00016 [Kwoniella bestiolae CBS 10118]